MTGREGYDVLRLIEHGQTCYISSEYVEGKILAGRIRSDPDITKEQLFSLMREIANQLSMIHKCRKKPYYQYVNPYSIVITDEGKPYFLDLEAGSNEKRLRFMQRRAVRECFLPKEEAYYQRASAKLDIYGLGKTLQYLLALSRPEPLLRGREERRFLRIISKCLNYQSRSAYQSAADIRRNIPQYKKKTELVPAARKRVFMAAAAAVILGVSWRWQKAYQSFEAAQESLPPKEILEESEEDAESDFQSEVLTRDRSSEYMELALAYILDLEDYEKSLYYLEKIQQYASAMNLRELAEALMGREKDPGILTESLRSLEEEAREDPTGRYYRCLLKGYCLMDTEQSAKAVLRLGRLCMERLDSGGEDAKEIRRYMAAAYEKTGEVQEAVKLYEEILDQETDAAGREDLYEKMILLYEAGGQSGLALETCVKGIGEIGGTDRLKVIHIRLMCKDAAIGRDLCARTIQEYIRQTPAIMENEGFQELMAEYEIQVEGEQVWVGR